MRTSLNEIREIDRYLQGEMGEFEAMEFGGKVRRDPVLQLNVMLQGKVMALIKVYHRKRLKAEMEEVHERLVSDPLKATWRERLLGLFQKN